MVLHGGNDRRDEDRRGQDAHRHARRRPQRARRQGRPRRHGQRLPGPPRRRVDEPDLRRARADRRRAAEQQGYEEKHVAYAADITYGTNSEFGFDYLRDNMATSLEEKVQHGQRIGEDGKPVACHNFAIVDEVDNILIDEARTPLIISGAPEQAADLYAQFAKLAPPDGGRQEARGHGPADRRRTSSPTSTSSSTRSTRPSRSPSRASRRPSGSSASTTSTAPRTATSSTTCHRR